MTKLIEAMFERSKACSELFEDQPPTKENYIEETVSEQQSSDSLTEELQSRNKEVLTRRKLSCPSLPRFRGTVEDDEYENYASNLYFVKERSVESDDGTTAAESVVDTLDKLHDINETVSKKTLGSRNKSRKQRTGYEGPAHLLVGGSSQFFKDFRRDEVYKKKMRDLIDKRVMSNTRFANSKSQCLMSESVSNLAIKTYHALKKLSAPHKYKTALVQQQAVFDCEIFVKKVARPKHCKARPTIQRIQDLQSGLYLYPTLVRDVATWGKVKQSSDGLKHKCEMFDTAADSSYCRATPLVQEVLVRASRCKDLVLLLPTQETLETQETAANLVALRTDINDLHGNLSRISFEPAPCRDLTRISLEVTQHRQAGWKIITDIHHINTTLIL